MAKPVQLSNGRQWKTRKAAIAHFSDMLGRYQDGDWVTDPGDDSDLRALMQLYDSVVPPGGETKTGVGIERFFRQRNGNDGYSTSGFHVHRIDGSSIDFSIYRAVETNLA
ncbi:DUF3223 domain-containing protein [Sphaerotilaceae bacterium SBD11-9]